MADKKRAFFESEKVGIWLDNISHRKVQTQDGEAPMVDLDFRIEPLTPELAAEIDPEIKRALFELTSGEARKAINSLGFNITIPQQNVQIFSTPDTERARLGLDRCDVSRIVARRVKGQDCFGLRFRFSFSHPSKEQHAYLSEHLYGQFFVTLEQTDPTLFEERGPFRKPAREEEQPRLVEAADDDAEVSSDDDAGDNDSITAGEPSQEVARLPMRRHADPRRAKAAKGRGGKGKAPKGKRGRK
jgi:hypothetical protein